VKRFSTESDVRSVFGSRHAGTALCVRPSPIGRISDRVVRRDTGSEYPPVTGVFVRVRNDCGGVEAFGASSRPRCPTSLRERTTRARLRLPGVNTLARQ
jgi:hypothetical protein